MATAGAAAGLLLDVWARRTIVALAPADWPAVAADVSLDWRVLLFTAGATSIATLACSSLPAWRVAVADPATRFERQPRRCAHQSGGSRVARSFRSRSRSPPRWC